MKGEEIYIYIYVYVYLARKIRQLCTMLEGDMRQGDGKSEAMKERRRAKGGSVLFYIQGTVKAAYGGDT